MYPMIRCYPGDGSVAEEAMRCVAQGLVSNLRQSPGFVGYCAFAGDDGAIHSVSLFDTCQAAEAAHARIRDWVQAICGTCSRIPANPPA